MKSGFVSIVGRTNVGKSTMCNALLHKKMSITSSKTQTTRTEIRGVLTSDLGQAVFVDTPGIHKPKRKVGTVTNRTAFESVHDSDLILFVVDQRKGITAGDKKVYETVAKSNKPIILAINKVDKTPKEEIAKTLEVASQLFDCIDYIPISAKNLTNLKELSEVIFKHLPEGPKYYDDSSDVLVTIKQYVEEVVREKYLWFMHEEIPHSIMVQVTSQDEETIPMLPRFVGDLKLMRDLVKNADESSAIKSIPKILHFDAKIFVERDSQKGIVIGAQGEAIKRVGTQAREELEELLGIKVFLKTKVFVEKDWQSNEDLINSYLK
jgi:GTP-binding protein Era